MVELKTEQFHGLIPVVGAAKINTLFAMSVLEGKVNGKVFADRGTSEEAFYIQHPYGMDLLIGENGNDDFYENLKPFLLNADQTRKKAAWLQVLPASLNATMDALFGNSLVKKDAEEPYHEPSTEEADKILKYQRLNFTFQKEKYSSFRRSLPREQPEIVSTTEEIFHQLDGNVVPKYFWNSSRDFKEYSIGFTWLIKGIPVSTAFASFVIGQKLEIGIETCADYRGFGFASRVCARLIDDCLERGLEPVWSCNSGNIGSRKLAQKLGFEECKRIPCYRLPATQPCK